MLRYDTIMTFYKVQNELVISFISIANKCKAKVEFLCKMIYDAS